MDIIKEKNPNRVRGGIRSIVSRREAKEVKEENNSRITNYGYIVRLIGVLAGGALVFLSTLKPTHTTMTEIPPPPPPSPPPPPPPSPKVNSPPKPKFVSTLEPFSD